MTVNGEQAGKRDKSHIAAMMMDRLLVLLKKSWTGGVWARGQNQRRFDERADPV